MSELLTQVPAENHGQLDEDAALRMDDILDRLASVGAAADPGAVMSAALRVYHAAVLGEVRMVPAETLLEACNRELAKRETEPDLH